jgi:hypothetical protein
MRMVELFDGLLAVGVRAAAVLGGHLGVLLVLPALPAEFGAVGLAVFVVVPAEPLRAVVVDHEALGGAQPVDHLKHALGILAVAPMHQQRLLPKVAVPLTMGAASSGIMVTKPVPAAVRSSEL